MNQLFLVYHTDIHKAERIVDGVYTTPKRLLKRIKEMMVQKGVAIKNGITLEKLKGMSVKEINDNVDYILIVEFYQNEPI